MRILAPRCRRTVLLALLLALAPAARGRDEAAKKEATRKDAAKNSTAEATLIVKCDESAKLTIDGEESTQTGPVRKYRTPPLVKTGKRYYYTIVAFWEPNNYTKITRKWKVYVKPGETVTVDMTRKDPRQPDHILVRWVPTPQKVVDAMLDMGKVGKGDVVYDLGCGDGRIPITAVSKYGARRGVGIDIDPERIKESKEAARAAKVEDRTEFRQENVLKLKDLGEATVVTLYMGDELNVQLRPILQKTLKPGTRIVSHRFLMGDWKPEKTQRLRAINVIGMEDDFEIHLWTIKGKTEPKKETPGKETPKKDAPKKEDRKETPRKGDKG